MPQLHNFSSRPDQTVLSQTCCCSDCSIHHLVSYVKHFLANLQRNANALAI
jgi:hypothetical protein